MKKLNLNFLYPGFALFLLVYCISQQMFQIPPVGKILNPFIGAIQNENEKPLEIQLLSKSNLGLIDTVHIYFDKRKVPHIYAKNDQDLFFAQGYVTAYLRLWQMDFISYSSAGRLSEIFKEGYLDYDRIQRRVGILEGAKASLKLIEKDKKTNEVMTNYTKGVNAYISQLNYKNMPLEYKLLDYKPEAWTKLKTVLIMKYIGNTLSGYEQDIPMTNLMLALGEKDFNKYFPSFNSKISPLIKDPVTKLNSSSGFIKQPKYLDFSFLNTSSVITSDGYNPRLGSNSWVVSGKKTKSGLPILCSDPHLNLSLPAIWLEMQLTAPGMNVYGVSIPGTPAVIIGFNENIAWGLTNGADDVKDWYKLKISADYKKYEFNNKWVNLIPKVEVIKRKDQSSFLDTVYYTIHGPILNDNKYAQGQGEIKNLALKWELNNPSNEFLTFIKLSKAKNFSDYKAAISSYSVPIQNFTFAGNDNTIAANHQGKMHVKWADQGRFILDGTKSSHLYSRYIPQDSLPQVVNPSDNYIISANQHPTSKNYPFNYNGYFFENRALRIDEKLRDDNNLDAAKMMDIQLDNISVIARDGIKVLAAQMKGAQLQKHSRELLDSLSLWNGEYNSKNTNAALFEFWMGRIKSNTWDEFKSYKFSATNPGDNVLFDLITNEPDNAYFDLLGTSKIENAHDIIVKSYEEAVESFEKLRKTGLSDWGDFNRISLMHLAKIEPFSKTNIRSAGHPETINAMGNKWGPSWRMIVELGKRPKAYGIFAGGQSGNAGGNNYDSFVKDWNEGKYYSLLFFMSDVEAKANSKNTWKLK